MYDLTRSDSFESLEDWLREVQQNSDPDVVIYLVGNVLDLANEEREVAYEQGMNFSKEYNLAGFMETSAKTAENVNEVFQ